VGFIFDREGRSEQEQADLKRQSDGRIHFTKRRMFENYLLDPAAVAELMTKRLSKRADESVSPQDVESWFALHGWERRYLATIEEDKRTQELWRNEVHGAKLLEDIFEEHKLAYDKVEDGIALVTMILQREPSTFSEVFELVQATISSAGSVSDDTEL
jgi:hypothetical protein